MDVEVINNIIKEKPNLSTALGMEFLSTPEDDTCMARMKVDERNRQPFGYLSGGATLGQLAYPYLILIMLRRATPTRIW